MPTNSGGSRVTDAALTNGSGQVTFAARYSYLQVTNLDTTAANALFVTTDGSTPTAGGGNNQYVVPPGATVLIPNDAALWYQGQGTPNPGTTINIVGASGASSKFSIVGV